MMKKISLIFTVILLFSIITACSKQNAGDIDLLPAQTRTVIPSPSMPPDVTLTQKPELSGETGNEDTQNRYFYITAGSTNFRAAFEDNSSAEAFKQMLEKGDITIHMSDYGNLEKVGDLGSKLPTNDEKITTEPGDVILYMGGSITVYYDTNTWSFTRLGKIENATKEKLLQAFGNGDVDITFSLKK